MVIFLLLPYFNIYYFGIDSIEPYIYIWRYVIVFISVIIIFKEINLFNILTFCIIAVILLSTELNGYTSGWRIFDAVTLFSFIIYISHATRNSRELLTGFYYLFSILIIFNFITMLMGGINTYEYSTVRYLLGGTNNIVMTIIPAIAVIYMYSYFRFGKLKISPAVIILLGVLSVYLTESATGKIVVSLFVIFITFHKVFLPSFKVNLLIYCTLFFIIVILRLHEKVFGELIVRFLDKDLTFTHRTYIWDLLLEKLSDSWLLGIGRGNSVINDHFIILYEEHNMILQLAVYSGVVGIILFLAILLLIGKKLDLNKDDIFSRILSFSIFSYLIVGLMESVFMKKEFWLLLALAYAVNRIIKQVSYKRPELNFMRKN